jgi:hypothetical protein
VPDRPVATENASSQPRQGSGSDWKQKLPPSTKGTGSMKHNLSERTLFKRFVDYV